MLNKKKKVIILFFLITFIVGNFIFIKKVFAQPDPTALPKLLLQIKQYEQMLDDSIRLESSDETLRLIKEEIKKQKAQYRKLWLKDLWRKIRDDIILRSGKLAYKNALRTFLSRLALDTATRIAEGGVGKSPLFNIKSMTGFLDDVWQTTLVDTLDILAKENGFFEFDVCQPENLNLSLDIQYSLFGTFGGRGARGKPRCTFRQITDKWGKWMDNVGRTYSTENFLNTLKGAFSPVQTDVGITLKLDSSIRSRLADEKLKQMFDYVSREGIQPVTEPITGFIKTPAAVTAEGAKELARGTYISENVPTGDIVADALGIFTNTLAAKLMKRLLSTEEGGLAEIQKARSTLVYNWANKEAIRQAQGALAKLAQVTYTSGRERVLEYLTKCTDAQSPGPTDCVMSPKIVTAIEQGLTVKEALVKGNLRGDGKVGYGGKGALSWQDDFPYRSLVIMRIHRIIPVGWELAALYAMQKQEPVTLQDLINCFEDPNHPTDPKFPEKCVKDVNGNGNIDAQDYNPYYHLVDPNWVLKAPEENCKKKSFGYEIISSSYECEEDNVLGTAEKEKDANGNITYNPVDGPSCDASLEKPDKEILTVTRSDEYCADRQSCLFDDENGNCLGDFGYCLKEKDIWRFPEGQVCEPYYNSCETLTRLSDNKQFSYLRNTLEECNSYEAGCLWYSTQAERAVEDIQQVWNWQDDSRIYLNEQAEQCEPDNAGCTKLSRMLPGTNTVFNGSFSYGQDGQMPDGWQLNEARCNVTYRSDLAVLTVGPDAGRMGGGGFYCSVESQGFAPIDSSFTYTLSAALISDSSQQADVGLRFYNADKSPIGDIHYNILDESNDISLEPADAWQVFKGQVENVPPSAKYAKVVLAGPRATDREHLGEVSFDSIQLVITESPVVRHNLENFSFDPTERESYQLDYSHNDSYGRQYLKVAPDYLGCDGYNDVLLRYNPGGRQMDDIYIQRCLDDGHYWRDDIEQCVRSGDSLCKNYAAVCKAQEVGCQGYRPLNNDPEVSAITISGDVCPVECVGYDSYFEVKSYFAQIEEPDVEPLYQNFIPDTAQICPAQDAGCEEFTNEGPVAEGGEIKEYFTYLRQCISPNNPQRNFYYTWEGSDTTGYQLKKWTLLRSNRSYDENNNGLPDGQGPCTNIAFGSEDCQDPENMADNTGLCTQEDLGTDPNCRDFFDKSGVHYLRWQDRTITASGKCYPYRRTLTGEIYNADPQEGRACAPSSLGCREYKGNQGNNVRNIFTDNFEHRTTGNWLNTAGNTTGLYPSNESVQQSGHSLQVAVSNDTLVYPLTGRVREGRWYELSFWAKKSSGAKAGVGNPNNSLTKLNFNINGSNMINDWALYNIGPVEISSISQDGAQLRLQIDNLGDGQVVFLDNVILKEYTNNFYVIKDTWQTPVSCDNPNNNPEGYVPGPPESWGNRTYPGAQLKCQQYLDRQNQTHYLKSFNSLCSSSAVGCEAYLDTQNSTNYQAERIYDNGICNSEVGAIDENGNCRINGRVVCNAGNGNSCSYMNEIKVANDKVIYLVNDPAKQCTADKQGCQRLGQPAFNRQVEDYTDYNYVSSYSKVYKINNPDNYGSTLCSESGLFCSKFKGELTSNKTYYDPVLSSLGSEDSNHTCFYSGGEWFKSGVPELCYENYHNQFLPVVGQYNYDGWAGVCPPAQSTCTEFRDPSSPISNEVEQCDAGISPQLEELCIAGANGVPNNNYCQLSINGVMHNVCEFDNVDHNGDGNAQNDCRYSAYDFICQGFEAAYYTQGDIDNHPEQARNEGWVVGALKPHHNTNYPYDIEEMTGNCVVNGQKVCFIPDSDGNNANNQPATCQYSLLCDSYYYLHNSLNFEETCSVVDREGGCLLFNDTSNPSLANSNKASPDEDESGPASCDAVIPASFGSDEYCDANLLLKVKKDRQCGEWLECRTGFENEKSSSSGSSGGTAAFSQGSGSMEFLCLDLYRCSQKGSQEKDCSKIVSTVGQSKSVYTLSADLDNTEVNQIRNLSGYSHPGLNWSNYVSTPGYISPEAMIQKGQQVPVVNGGFESYLANDLKRPEGWLNAASDSNNIQAEYNDNICSQTLDNALENVHSGHYSLKISLEELHQNKVCSYRSDKFYKIDPTKYYNLSFYAKSQNSGQKAQVGFAWFDSNYQRCNNQHNPPYCLSDDQSRRSAAGESLRISGPHGESLISINPPQNEWQKYILSVGPGPVADYEIPAGAEYARIIMPSHNSYFADTNLWSTPGAIWFDDFALEPILELNPSNNLATAKECRLYPTEDATACSYQGATAKYEGWQGYCLEPDPFYQLDPLEPNNWQACLQWYPVDTLLGDRLSVFRTQNIGYTDRAPLYYCLQTKGTYNYLLRNNDVQVNAGQRDTQHNNDFIGTSGYKYQSVINICLEDDDDDDDENPGSDVCDNAMQYEITNNIHNNIYTNIDGKASIDWEAGCRPSYDNRDHCRDRTCIRNPDSPSCYNSQCNNYDHDACFDNAGDCQWVEVAGSSELIALCGQQPANQCSEQCSFYLPRGAENGWLEADYASLTLNDIGAIYFDIVFQENPNDGVGQGGFLSDVTDSIDNLDDDLLLKPKAYYKKFEKIYNINASGDNRWYSLTMAFGKTPNSGISHLLRFELKQDDANRDGSYGIGGQIYYYLKDQCSLIAQATKLEGEEVKEKVWLSRFNNWTEQNDLGFNKNLEISPYGSFYPPRSSTPEYWSTPGPNNRKDAPLYVYNGGSFDFGPSAGVPWSVPDIYVNDDYNVSERICISSSNNSMIGKTCLSSADCGTDGVCSGIGQYCYSATGIMNGQSCSGAEGERNNCPVNYICHMPENLALSKEDAIARLQDLFAKVYGIWQWNDSAGQYVLCSPFGDEDCGLNLPNIDGRDGLTVGDFDNSRSAVQADHPKVANVAVSGNNLQAPGGKVELSFTTEGSANQLPVEGIWIDWQDGSGDYFKGPFGYRPNPDTPAKAYHVYTCYTNDRGDRCVACIDGTPADADGSCTYEPPRVNIKDHWGWCANASQQTSAWVDENACEPENGSSANLGIEIRAR